MNIEHILSLVKNSEFEEDDEEEDEPLPYFERDVESTPIVVSENPIVVSETPEFLLSLVKNVDLDDDDEEEDEPLPAFEPIPEPVVDYGSSEFVEASRAISANVWDVNAWILYIEEVDGGRSGSLSIVDAYHRFLAQFPSSSRYWRLLSDYYIQREEYTSAEDLFRKCLLKCRSVGLWQSYLEMVRKKTIDKTSKYSENYLKERDTYRMAFEKALENIGLSLESKIIWRKYIDFVRDWPEVTDLDQGRKLNALREVYRRAIVIPTDDIDHYWREYEALEKQTGGDNQHLAELVLAELQPRCAHAKLIERERRRVSARIELDRLARPPQHIPSEALQLEQWNKWIKYEMSNPANLSPEDLRTMMSMVYDQCLCCMRYHPEIWLSLAKYQATVGGVTSARTVLREAIDVLPTVAILRFALSELEERQGNYDVARDVLISAFQDIPSALTFAALQRLVRRLDGKLAARRLFSETLPLRANGVLDHEVFMAHAMLELDVNQEPQTALRVVEMARAAYPPCITDIGVVRLSARILVRLGDVVQLRWVFSALLGDTDDAATISTSTSSSASSTLSASDRFALYEEYLYLEFQLGVSDNKRLDELKTLRDKAQAALDVAEKRTPTDSADRYGVFESAVELLERYSCLVSSMPAPESGLQLRANSSLVDSESRVPVEEKGAGIGAELLRRRSRRDEPATAVTVEPVVPVFLKDLLTRLPPHFGPLPDVDSAVEQLRRAVLPPRPIDDSEMSSLVNGTDGVVSSVGKHDRDETDASKWPFGQANNADEFLDGPSLFDDNRSDVFRRRQRMRLIRQAPDY